MRQIVLIASATALGLATGGCGFLPFGGGDTAATDPTTVGQSPVIVSPASPQDSPTTPGFAQPTVQQKDGPKGILPPDLISSTDPNQRVQQVKGDRADPFALLPTTPSVQLPAGATLPVPITIVPNGTTAVPRGLSPQTRTAPKNTTNGSGSGGSGSGGSGRSPNRTASQAPNVQKPPRSPIKAAPPRPQPELARAVKVTGVVQIGDTVYAIVNAPNEPTSRYVQEGQRLSNGQVLVRRIETNRAEPVVVLEQYGVEVLRAVGEGVAPATTPAAVVPVNVPIT